MAGALSLRTASALAAQPTARILVGSQARRLAAHQLEASLTRSLEVIRRLLEALLHETIETAQNGTT